MYLIDGYNLLHALRKLFPREIPRDVAHARRRLMQLLADFRRGHGKNVLVFFDGNPGPLGEGDLQALGVSAKFCGPGDQTADRALHRYCEHAAQADELTVVSSDREVRRRCKLEGAQTESSEDFSTRLGVGAPRQPEARKPAPTPSEPAKRVTRREQAGLRALEDEMAAEIDDLLADERRMLDEPDDERG